MTYIRRLVHTQLKPHVGGMMLRLMFAIIVATGPYIFSFMGKWLVDDVIQIHKKPVAEAGQAAPQTGKVLNTAEEKSGWTIRFKAGTTEGRLKLLGMFAALSLLIHLVFTAISGTSEYVGAKLNHAIMFRMRRLVYNKVQRLDATLFNREPMGQMMGRIMDDTANIPGNLTNLVINSVTQLAMLALGIFLLARLNPTLMLYALGALPLYGVSCVLLLPRIRRNAEDLRNRIALFKGFIFERMINIMTVKNYAQEDAEIERFNTALDDNLKLNRQQQKLNLAFNTSTNLINSIGATLVLAIGFTYIRNGSMTLGEVLAFHQVTAQLFVPIGALVGMGAVVQNINISAERIYSVVDAQNEVTDGSDPIPANLHGDVAFENVSLQYQEDGPYAVKDVSFEIPAGKTVCIVGPTGCGKSTLISLLTRLHDVDTGNVLIGGHNVKSFPVADLRRAVGNVFSSVPVFTGTLAENIVLGTPDVPFELIKEVGAIVGLDALAGRLPKGYETSVGVGGEALERDELARLAFARALITKPLVLTVDDTFAAFSEDAEEQLRLAIELHLTERTILIATSRLSICPEAGLILVMRKGTIVQTGTHDELMSQPGLYQRMYSRQMGLLVPSKVGGGSEKIVGS